MVLARRGMVEDGTEMVEWFGISLFTKSSMRPGCHGGLPNQLAYSLLQSCYAPREILQKTQAVTTDSDKATAKQTPQPAKIPEAVKCPFN